MLIRQAGIITVIIQAITSCVTCKWSKWVWKATPRIPWSSFSLSVKGVRHFLAVAQLLQIALIFLVFGTRRWPPPQLSQGLNFWGVIFLGGYGIPLNFHHHRNSSFNKNVGNHQSQSPPKPITPWCLSATFDFLQHGSWWWSQCWLPTVPMQKEGRGWSMS